MDKPEIALELAKHVITKDTLFQTCCKDGTASIDPEKVAELYNDIYSRLDLVTSRT